VIRFSAFLVAVAVGLLVAGVVTSKLLLVYLAIGVSGVALLALGVGAAVKWRELSGKPQAAVSEADVREPVSAQAQHVQAQQAPVPLAAVPQAPPEHQPAAAGAAALWESAVPPTGMFPPVRPGEPGDTQRRPAAFTPLPASGAPASRATRPAGQDQPGATDRQAPETEPSPQDLRPAADSRPMTDLQDTESPPSTQQAAEGTAQAAPDTVQPAAVQPAAAPAPPSPEPPAVQPTAAVQPPAVQPPAVQPPAVQPPAVQPAPTPTPARLEPDAAGPEPVADPAPAATDPDPQTRPTPQTIVTVVPGVPRYHNANCILIRFMGESDLETMTLAAARETGLTPCRACLPDQPDKQPDLPPPRAPVRYSTGQVAGSAIGRLQPPCIHFRFTVFRWCIRAWRLIRGIMSA
jgi:hypothetical protein